MRSAIVASLVAAVLSTSSFALAEAGTKKKKASKPKPKSPPAVMVAAAVEPLPALPAPEPPAPAPATAAPAAAPAKDAPAAAPASSVPPSAGPGFVMVIGSGASFMGGQIAKDLPIAAGLVSFDLKLGGYITPHFGLMAGVQAGYGALFDGCSGTCVNAVHYQLPIVAEYAFKDRRRGAYIEGGIGILSTYLASTGDSSDDPPETLEVSSPVDFKLGVGYRLPSAASPGKTATSALDLRLGVDLGQFKKLEYGSIAGDVAGDIVSDRQAMHFAIGLSAGYYFAP